MCRGWEEVVDLAGDVAFQAADDVFLGEPVAGSSFDVGHGRRVPAHADDDDAVERGVRLSVAAPVEAVPAAGLAGSGGDRAGAAQLRERGFGGECNYNGVTVTYGSRVRPVGRTDS